MCFQNPTPMSRLLFYFELSSVMITWFLALYIFNFLDSSSHPFATELSESMRTSQDEDNSSSDDEEDVKIREDWQSGDSIKSRDLLQILNMHSLLLSVILT